MVYSKERITNEILFDLLKTVDNSFFNEPLSHRVDLAIYAKKLAHNAAHFSCFENSELIGVFCCYMNDLVSKTAYISIGCICPAFQGKGIGHKLTKMCEDEAINKGFRFIECEIHNQNIPVIKMYKKMGYCIARKENESFFMRKYLLMK